ncbi:MAG: hypothetical protein ABSH24_20600 [Bryobacteraceae bacterium]|jgi:hypothetical protein
MTKRVLFLSIAGLMAFASGGYAQYTMDLTGVGDGANADGVYVSPYAGSIWTGAYTGGSAPTTTPVFSGAVICDDFTDESYVGDIWNASATNAGALNGTELFTTSDTTYTVQQNYDAVAWLANQLLLPANVYSGTAQTNISFAIWDIMDGQKTDPDGGATGLITSAFAAVTSGYVGTNVDVFTPAPKQAAGSNVSQEFLVVNGPTVPAPEPASAAVLGFDLLSALGIVFLVRRYRVRA